MLETDNGSFALIDVADIRFLRGALSDRLRVRNFHHLLRKPEHRKQMLDRSYDEFLNDLVCAIRRNTGRARERFDRPDVTGSYADRKNIAHNCWNRREMTGIQRAFEGVPAGSKVLDLPTGIGGLLPMRVKRGYQVAAADYSSHMLEQARKYFAGLPG